MATGGVVASLHRFIAVLLLLGALAACSSNVGPAETTQASASSSARAVSQSDSEIAALLYSDSQRTPAGFYSETVPVVNGYVSTRHVRNTDFNISTTPYELCSDDWNQALGWSQSRHTTDGAQAVGDSATELYFEFDWTIGSAPQNYLRERVFKCAYVDRFGTDLDEATGAGGVLNARPLNVAALKTLSEYLWQFTGYNNFGNVVLKSAASSDGSLAHSLIMATLTAGTGGACDTIQVFDYRLGADNGGVLTTQISTLWSFNARQTNSVVTLCN